MRISRPGGHTPHNRPHSLPYKRPNGHARKKTAARNAIANRRAEAPALFVTVGKRAFGAVKYVRAHLRIRRDKYRYLVWRDGDRIREFYLGKIEIGALRVPSQLRQVRSSPAPAVDVAGVGHKQGRRGSISLRRRS